MPEAAIDVYGDASTDEDNVSPTAHVWQWGYVDSVAQAAPMEMPPQGDLRVGIALSGSLHAPERLWR